MKGLYLFWSYIGFVLTLRLVYSLCDFLSDFLCFLNGGAGLRFLWYQVRLWLYSCGPEARVI